MMIKQREVLQNHFHVNYDVNNELFQFESRLSLRQDDKQLQQSTLAFNSAKKKVSVQEVAKVQERTKKLGKEGTGFRNVHCWFSKGMVQWRRNLVKNRHKFKAKAKNRHKDRMQGENNSKFPLIIEQCRNRIFTTKLDFYSASSENV